jgi:hypothetical protein
MGRLWFDDIAERTDWAAERAAFVPVSAETLISLYVFHCPHAGHLPIHFADSCPQLEHTYIVLSLAISLELLYRNSVTPSGFLIC